MGFDALCFFASRCYLRRAFAIVRLDRTLSRFSARVLTLPEAVWRRYRLYLSSEPISRLRLTECARLISAQTIDDARLLFHEVMANGTKSQSLRRIFISKDDDAYTSIFELCQAESFHASFVRLPPDFVAR